MNVESSIYRSNYPRDSECIVGSCGRILWFSSGMSREVDVDSGRGGYIRVHHTDDSN
jgi:hypothetical protein